MTPEVFAWARDAMAEKKPELAGMLAEGRARRVRFAEGPCAQVMHCGPYDDEPAAIERLQAFAADEGLLEDIAAVPDGADVLLALDSQGAVPEIRLHHEIYLGDPRRTKPENLRTVIRHPVRASGR